MKTIEAYSLGLARLGYGESGFIQLYSRYDII